MTINADTLLFKGGLRTNASQPGYLRMVAPSGKLANFVEFQASGVETMDGKPVSQPSVVESVQLYVPLHHQLYFSDYPAPPPIGPPVITQPVNFVPNPPHGLEGSDGNPVTQLKGPPYRRGITLTGTSKAKDSYGVTVQVKTQAASPVDYKYVAPVWLFGQATFTRNETDPVKLTLGFSPTDLTMRLNLGRGNVNSTLVVTLGHIDPGTSSGYALLTRTVTYYNEPLVTQTLQVQPTAQTSGMHLASSPMADGLDAMGYMAPALAYMGAQQSAPALAGRTGTEWLASIDFNNPAYVAATIQAIQTGLSSMALMMIDDTSNLGGTLRWLAGMMTQGGAGSPLNTAVVDSYSNGEAWIKKQPATDPWRGPLPTMKSNTDEGVAQQAIDKLFDD